MTATLTPPAPLAPVLPALAGFAVAGVILVALDVGSPAAVVTETISWHATTAGRAAFVLALIASGAGVAVALAAAWPRITTGAGTDVALLALWPIGIGIASVFDQDVHSWTGTVHNVAVGTAITAVHLAALRTRSRSLTVLAVAGVASMAAVLVLITMHVAGVPGVPLGVAERVLVLISVTLMIGTLRCRRRAPARRPATA